MASTPFLFHKKEDGIEIAVDSYLLDQLEVSRGFPFQPQPIPGPRPVVGLSSLLCFGKGFVVHIGQHEHLAGRIILGDGWNKSLHDRMVVDISYKGLMRAVSQCVSCKGRGFCGRPVCPILRRFEEITALPKIGLSIEGLSPPEVFVGRHGYPIVRAGPMIPAGEHGQEDRVPSLAMDIGEIIAHRASLVRSEARIGVHEAGKPGRLLETAQQIAMSSAPVGTEVLFSKPPRGSLRFDGVLSPTGPAGTMKDMEITTNPVIPRKVDRIVEDPATGAAAAATELYSSGIKVDHISRLLSLGLGKERKLVPTRWSITASDDVIGKSLKDAVLDKPLISGYRLYSGEDLGNHFEILLQPGTYSFELVEIWMPRSVWSPDGFIGSDSEGPKGKKGYSPLAGGYYAARLAALELMATIGRQASVLAVREISEGYWAPLGVWVVREAARKAARAPPKRFTSLNEALEEMGRRIATPICKWKPHTKLATGTSQVSLADFS